MSTTLQTSKPNRGRPIPGDRPRGKQSSGGCSWGNTNLKTESKFSWVRRKVSLPCLPPGLKLSFCSYCALPLEPPLLRLPLPPPPPPPVLTAPKDGFPVPHLRHT